MFDETSFFTDAFDQDSWLFLLEVPYFDLTRKQRVHVRHVLQSVYALDVVERIVSVAERNNLSAIDSVEVIRAQTGDSTLVVLPRRKVTTDTPLRAEKSPSSTSAKEARTAYAIHRSAEVNATAQQSAISAAARNEFFVAEYAQENIVVTHKPSRSAHTPT